MKNRDYANRVGSAIWLAEDQRSGAFESRKVMLDLEHQSELEERQEQPEGSADATRSRADSESDSVQTNCPAGKNGNICRCRK